MFSKDAWDEALLGSEQKKLASKPSSFLPAPVISKSLIPLTGLLIALVVTSVSASGLQFQNFSTIKEVTLGSAGRVIQTAWSGLSSGHQLVAKGYNNLGEAALVVSSRAADNLTVQLSDLGEVGNNNLNQVAQVGAVAGDTAVQAANKVTSEIGSWPEVGGLMAASAGVSVSEWYGVAATGLTSWFLNVRDFIFAYGQEIGARWRAFLGKDDQLSATATSTVSLDTQTKNDLLEIKSGINEILQKLNQGAQVTPTGKLPSEGVVVVPKVGSATPATLRSKVGGLFSDQVSVQLDESGKAGVITPLFRRGPGEDYLFVLTPITP
jgi:hypothetical protein